MLPSKPTIVVDTREQWPYEFADWPTRRAKLNAGDYSLEGHEFRVAVERKSKEDAYRCVGRSRERFVRCLERLKSLDRAAIVIEASLDDFANPPARTIITAAQAIGSYISWSVCYGVHVIWAPNRAYGERVVLRFLLGYLKCFAGNMGGTSVTASGAR